jgi:hypothetical protein
MAGLAVSAPAMACEAVTAGWGLKGRFSEAEFLNTRPAGARHENWIARGARLILHAGYDRETDDYGHGILGPLRDARILTIHVRRPGDDRITCPAGVVLPAGQVFEDIAPRLADLDGDGMPEIIVVQSDATRGARLAVYDRRANLMAATPFIGTPYRWLAPLGAADLDGDGAMELAYVDRPHLARILRVWRYTPGKLTEVATRDGLTNHRIGEAHISGGIRDCGGSPEMILATGDWRALVAAQFDGHTIGIREIGTQTDRDGFARAMSCD